MTIRMHCNWPLLNVQLMVNEAWLFTFWHWTHGCDVNIVKNYLKKWPVKVRYLPESAVQSLSIFDFEHPESNRCCYYAEQPMLKHKISLFIGVEIMVFTV